MCISIVKAEGGSSILKLREKKSFEIRRAKSLISDFIESLNLNFIENF